MTLTKRDHELIRWKQAPAARYCLPREEHLLPLHVCYRAAAFDAPLAELVFNGDVLGVNFQYGLDQSSMSETAAASPDSGNASGGLSVTAEITGLPFETLYYYQMVESFPVISME